MSYGSKPNIIQGDLRETNIITTMPEGCLVCCPQSVLRYN